jgi:hypothetical protein
VCCEFRDASAVCSLFSFITSLYVICFHCDTLLLYTLFFVKCGISYMKVCFQVFPLYWYCVYLLFVFKCSLHIGIVCTCYFLLHNFTALFYLDVKNGNRIMEEITQGGTYNLLRCACSIRWVYVDNLGMHFVKMCFYSIFRKRKANWIGHIFRRNCLLQRVIEGKIQGRIEVTGRQGRRRMKLLDDFNERRRYSHLKEEALDRTMWRARLGIGFGPVVRQTT